MEEKLCASCQHGKPKGKFVNCYYFPKKGAFLVRTLTLAEVCQYYKVKITKTKSKFKRKVK